EQHQRRPLGFHEAKRVAAARRFRHLVATAVEHMRLDVAVGLVVVDDEDAGLLGHAGRTSGAVIASRMAATSVSEDSSDLATMRRAEDSRRWRCSALRLIEVSTMAGTPLVAS